MLLLEIILIVAVFGTILAVFLYKYLLQSPEYRTKTAESTAIGAQPTLDLEKVAEKLFKLDDKVDDLEADINNLHSYLSQKVEQSKKKQNEKTHI